MLGRAPMDKDLFDAAGQHGEPLASRMRPRTVEEFVGQEHILGPGRLLRRAIQADQLASLIFYGPPGTGKTTLARVIANTTRSHFVSINAVLAGVKEIREATAEADSRRKHHGRRTTLFVDEVHRWNKAQQDALLPWVENGTVVLIGATTENPFFEVNPALVSRSRIFQLKPLSSDDLRTIAERTLKDQERGYGAYQVSIEPEALEHLVDVSGGDARTLLNALELAVETTPERFPPSPGEPIRISLSIAEESIQRRVVLYDKEGDYHFDTISAFIKSLRGSDPDAALYWLARMVYAGEDPRFLFRRMLIFACEDVGLADPQALAVAEAAAAAFDRVGLPEGRFHLAQAALYLATAPKSNSSLAFFDALAVVEKEQAGEVPSHLRDPSRDAEGFGHGEGYLYPHSYREHWVAQQYLPDRLQGRVFYQPSGGGRGGARPGRGGAAAGGAAGRHAGGGEPSPGGADLQRGPQEPRPVAGAGGEQRRGEAFGRAGAPVLRTGPPAPPARAGPQRRRRPLGLGGAAAGAGGRSVGPSPRRSRGAAAGCPRPGPVGAGEAARAGRRPRRAAPPPCPGRCGGGALRCHRRARRPGSGAGQAGHLAPAGRPLGPRRAAFAGRIAARPGHAPCGSAGP